MKPQGFIGLLGVLIFITQNIFKYVICGIAYYITQIMLSACAGVILTSAFLYNEPHIFHPATMLCTGGNDINSRGVNV